MANTPFAAKDNQTVTTALRSAVGLVRSGRPLEALPFLSSAIANRISVSPLHTLHLEALISAGLRREALAALNAALALEQSSADAVDGLAFFARQLDQHELSQQLYQRATQMAPADAQLWYNLATSERTIGELGRSAAACAMALKLDPSYRPAVLLRSEVARATGAANNVADIKSRIATGGDVPEQMFLYYALGKELHELGDFDEAFEAFAQGAGIRRRSLRYDVSQDERKIARIAEAYGTNKYPLPSQTVPGRHIFIVGLPRSGTTLTERILGGLRNVRSNNETNNLSIALMRAAPSVGGDVFTRAARADPVAVAREYESLALIDDFAGSVIEKLPFNYLYVGAILHAFPTAPIVWVRRNPIDSCFAMFRTLFGAAYPFSYDFADLARYFAAYMGLMRHWERMFPDQLIPVDYEQLVAEPDLVGQRLAKRCGLDWTNQALDISLNRSASLTASASQVRDGIYASSSRMWRRYEQHLAPLIASLHNNGVDMSEHT